MAMQTRRTTQRSAKCHSATIKAYIVTACCGLLLLNTVSAHAGISVNGIATNGITANGITVNGITTNGITLNGISTNGITMNGIHVNGLSTNGLAIHEEPPPAVQGKTLPLHGLSQKALGQTPPHRLGLFSLCSRYRLVPLCL